MSTDPNEDKNEAKIIVGDFSGSKTRRGRKLFRDKKRLFIFVLLFLCIAVVAGLLFRLKDNRENSQQAAQWSGTHEVCGSEEAMPMLISAQEGFAHNKLNQVAPIAESIEQKANYDRDPDCLYVLVKYHTKTSNYDKAKLYLDKLEAVYDDYNGFSPLLQPTNTALEDLKKSVEFLRFAQEEFQRNQMQGPELP